MNVNDFGRLTRLLGNLPDKIPITTVTWDKKKHDLEFEWHFGENNYVQFCIGDNFPEGTIYRCINKKCEYTKYNLKILINWLSLKS